MAQTSGSLSTLWVWEESQEHEEDDGNEALALCSFCRVNCANFLLKVEPNWSNAEAISRLDRTSSDTVQWIWCLHQTCCNPKARTHALDKTSESWPRLWLQHHPRVLNDAVGRAGARGHVLRDSFLVVRVRRATPDFFIVFTVTFALIIADLHIGDMRFQHKLWNGHHIHSAAFLVVVCNGGCSFGLFSFAPQGRMTSCQL